MTSVQATKTDETKKDMPSQSEQGVKKMEEESLSKSPAEPGKKKRKLNDGSSSKADEQSTGFFSSLSSFLSGSWLWSSSTPAKGDVAVEAKDTTSEKESAESTKAAKEITEEEGHPEPLKEGGKASEEKGGDESKAPGDKTAEEEAAPKDLMTVTNSSVDSDDDEDDNVQSGDTDDDNDNEDENEEEDDEVEELEQSPHDQQKVVPGKSESPKAVAVEIRGSRKRRRLS